MKLGLRLFFGYLIISAVCFYYPIDWMLNNLKTRYLEGVEDPLVDQAHILARLVADQMENGEFDSGRLYDEFQKIYETALSSRIYTLLKTEVDMRVYITDENGIVRFDSKYPENIGADYSRWRDVHRTLNGAYGARTTDARPADPMSSILYVAAPICVHNELAGVLTVAKPTTNIKFFLELAKARIFRVGMAFALAAIFLGFLWAVWITRPIKRLTRYANQVRTGQRVELPRLDNTEIGEMGLAFEKMRQALAGKQYVEHYVQNLTHEIKSPLSAIRGAAELLNEKMPPARQALFLQNIRNETSRIQDIVDRMLALSALENRKTLSRRETIDMQSLVNTVMESKGPLLSQKNCRPAICIKDSEKTMGDAFLLHQAVSNLVQNAIDFSPANSRIFISVDSNNSGLTLIVDNPGPAIPVYAEERIFEKFFSLKRPGTRKKSTGLGLRAYPQLKIE